jgi:elongator complex protein 1
MKNLVLLGEQRRRVELSQKVSDEERYIVDVCQVLDDDVESEEPARVILTNDGMVVRMTETGDVAWTCNLQEIKSGGGWFDISYVDPELVCLSKSGAIISVSTSTGEAELIGDFEYGLEAAVWSPDREVLLMVTAAADDEDETKTKSVMLTMNTQWEVLAEVNIETYVASSEAKDATVSAVWRPDGTLFSVSTVDAADDTRKVRIYRRDTLELHAIGRSEDASGKIVKGIGGAGFTWASAGCSQLLTAVQRKGKKTLQVIFFESNGLRHREFVLQEAPTTIVISLDWNVDSDLLAVTLREENGTDKVQLWHRSNYHWYLKQEFRYPNQAIACTKFDDEKPYKLYVLLRSLEWREYEVRWDPSSTLTSSSGCSAFAVDGCILHTTPLDKAMVPPPMYLHSSTMDLPICQVSFCQDENLLVSSLASLSDGSLVLFGRSNTEQGSVIKVEWGSTGGVDITALRSFLIAGANSSTVHIIAVECAPFNGQCEKLVEVTVSLEDPKEATADITNTFALEDRLLRMVNWSDSSYGALLQLEDGSLLEYETNETGGSVFPSQAEPPLEPCPWINALKDVSPYDDSEHAQCNTRLVIGLSAKSRLYCRDMLLTDSASSFFLSTAHKFLCYATSGSRCQLRFLPLIEVYNFDPLMGSDQNHILEGYEPREVERGTRLVAILPTQPTAVLQMPRGNLEGVYPRALVLRYVMTKITAGEYGDAFRTMRRQKVDLNLIVDMNPLFFLGRGISSFVEQVKAIEYLNLFISSLQDWDITQSRFPIPTWLSRDLAQTEEQTAFDFSTKVNQVCRKARQVMLELEAEEQVSEGHFLLPVLSTFAKENPPQLEDALSLIRENALKNSPESSKKPPMFSESAQNSIHYLAFLAEYELLFNTALGMYDFDLARGVARNSQMDPKIYLPLLKRLRSLPTFYGRYEVDLRLKRYESALSNLVQSGLNQESFDEIVQEPSSMPHPIGNSFAQCMALIDEHSLHQLGLKLFENNPSERRVIYLSLGEYLLRDRRAQTAMSVFLAADPPELEGARRAARACGDWRCYFSLLENEEPESDSNISEAAAAIKLEQARQLARQVADEVVAGTAAGGEAKRQAYASAARIMLDYGKDVVGAAEMLLAGEMWSECRRVARLHSRQDLVKKSVDGAISFAQTIMVDLDERSENFLKANKRYAEVIKLRKQATAVEGSDPVEEDETGSLFSSASTASNMSLRSNTSTSSTGSATSVSSVISVKTATTFTMTGDDEANRHRSKFNKGKRQKKQRKKKGKRMTPGSEEELQSLVATLKGACVDPEYAQTIAETCHFLVVVQHVDLAKELFESYTAVCDTLSRSQTERIDTTRDEKLMAERQLRKAGDQHEDTFILIELPIEKEVDALSCPVVEQTLQDFFSFS